MIDGGNSWFKDTQRREAELRDMRLNFFGMGVSGGEEGANRCAAEDPVAVMPGLSESETATVCITSSGSGQSSVSV